MSDHPDPTLLLLTERVARAISAWRARLDVVSGPVSDETVVDVLEDIVARLHRADGSVERPASSSSGNVVNLAERRLQKQGYDLAHGDEAGTTKVSVAVSMVLEDELLDRLLARFDHDVTALGHEVVRRGVASLVAETPEEDV